MNVKSGTFAEYKEFKQAMKNISKVLDWDDDQFGKEVFLSLSGKAAEHINDMPSSDICNVSNLFNKLGKTLLPKNYQRAVLEEFRFFKYKTGNKLSEFYKDLKTAYMKARPSAHSTIMEEDVTAQLCKTIPPEVYAKCLSNFHLKDQNIACRYDELISRLKCDNYIKVNNEVDKESTESTLTILKGTPKVDPCGQAQKKVTFDHLNYYEYDTRPNNDGQANGNRNNRRSWNNRNRNSDSSPNRGDNSSSNQGNTNHNRNANQGRGNRPSLVCIYGHCGLRRHKEEDQW